MKKSYISVLNCLACFLVVLLHVNGDFWNYSKNMRWILSNLVECIGYCAVPIFFMISGVNLCLLSKLKTLDFTDFCPIFWYNDCKDFDKNKSFFLQFSYRF